MNDYQSDIVIRYIRTKNKIRKLATYRSVDCELRIKHEKINRFITDRFIPSLFTKGYVKNKSIYHNAYAHLYNDYFIMLDIKDFFPNICHKQLIEKLYYELNISRPDQIKRNECSKIVNLCSIGDRGLPLGFITSPVLSNVYLKEFDGIFYGKLKKMGFPNIIYTRYADDITVSFRCDDKEKKEDIECQISELAESILARYGLHLNKKKTRSYSLNISNHVKITGINIIKEGNNYRRLSVGRSIKNKLFWDALECYNSRDEDTINKVKGMQSFVLSVERRGYESVYSDEMKKMIRECGFETLKDLIDSL